MFLYELNTINISYLITMIGQSSPPVDYCITRLLLFDRRELFSQGRVTVYLSAFDFLSLIAQFLLAQNSKGVRLKLNSDWLRIRTASRGPGEFFMIGRSLPPVDYCLTSVTVIRPEGVV